MSRRDVPARARPLALVTLALLALAGATGCNEIATFGPNICDRSEAANPLTRFEGGEAVDGVYMSSPWQGELLFFPGGMRYELSHRLGAEPRLVQPYVSFERGGSDAGPTPTLSLAVGNQAELVRIDDEVIVVRNNSCSDYWLLVVASAAATAGPDGP